MILQIQIPDSGDISSIWEPDFKISSKISYPISKSDTESILISMNSAGLISMARHLLWLAQPERYIGKHFHFDDSNSLEPGSVELVVEKIK